MKIFNRRARFNYIIIDTLEAGIVLSGPEVKSIRNGRIDLQESFARIQSDGIYLKNAYIHPYQGQILSEYNPKRDRKLLLHKKQTDDLKAKSSKGGMALIPLSIYSTRNMFKIELGLGASKKKFDKRRAIKEQDEARRLAQELKGY